MRSNLYRCSSPEYTVTQVDQLFVDAYLLAHEGSFISTIDHPCTAPVFIDVCVVPGYYTESVEQGDLSIFMAQYPGSFLVTDEVPCEEQLPYCHFDETENLWSQLTGYLSQLVSPDFPLAVGGSCPVKVPYCHYDASADSWTNGEIYAKTSFRREISSLVKENTIRKG